ncbi:AzlD domain-containing protein [Bacillus massiliigorillae]|uniref:AzlD domain-containing protein n=1 Tax=Bacillus massiliigorillae TaxID=1243664 RepID=UPI0003A0CA12|nr:AzlD domain-containing protein [Bacillus massiliigorillae]
MSVDTTILLIILGCALVTVIPRIVPFMLVRNIELPQLVIKWLSFIPVCILTALVVDSVLIEADHGIAIDWNVLIVIVPTLFIALWTKSLSITVIVGVILMAIIRFIF